jgi:CBS domain-containing protein
VVSIQDLMTPNPVTLPTGAAVIEAAQIMRDVNVGDVLVLDDHGTIHGVLTDRDVVVRAVAEGRDPAEITVGEICSKALVVLSAADGPEDAVRLMREQAVRRLPVVDAGKPVGIVSLGDLARGRDPRSVLADISAAPPNI